MMGITSYKGIRKETSYKVETAHYAGGIAYAKVWIYKTACSS